MKITVDEKILQKNGLTVDEFLVLYLCAKEVDILKVIEEVIKKRFADADLKTNTSAVISNNVKELLSSIIIDSDKAVIDKEEEFLSLADKMRMLYPEGKKPGTNYYWRDSAPIVAKKLKTVVTKFGVKFTEEEALKATKKYVDSFGYDKKLMHLLKYFILKTDKATGEIKSEFMSILENINDKDSDSKDWTVSVK